MLREGKETATGRRRLYVSSWPVASLPLWGAQTVCSRAISGDILIRFMAVSSRLLLDQTPSATRAATALPGSAPAPEKRSQPARAGPSSRAGGQRPRVQTASEGTPPGAASTYSDDRMTWVGQLHQRRCPGVGEAAWYSFCSGGAQQGCCGEFGMQACSSSGVLGVTLRPNVIIMFSSSGLVERQGM